MIQCKTCGKDWSEKTTGQFEVSSEDGLVKCPDCMTKPIEKMIPLSVVDAMIIRFKDITPSIEVVFSQKDFIWAIVENLEKLKKEAIPVPDYEQRIRDRITELEYKKNHPKQVEGFNARQKAIFEYGISEVIDELRKLLK